MLWWQRQRRGAHSKRRQRRYVARLSGATTAGLNHFYCSVIIDYGDLRTTVTRRIVVFISGFQAPELGCRNFCEFRSRFRTL